MKLIRFSRLRPFEDSDAWDLYEQAKSPDVGPIVGWPPHGIYRGISFIFLTHGLISDYYEIKINLTNTFFGCRLGL